MAKIDMKSLARQIVERCGRKDNLISVDHCSTRLRLYVKEEAKMDIEGLKKIKEVILEIS